MNKFTINVTVKFRAFGITFKKYEFQQGWNLPDNLNKQMEFDITGGKFPIYGKVSLTQIAPGKVTATSELEARIPMMPVWRKVLTTKTITWNEIGSHEVLNERGVVVWYTWGPRQVNL
jgi:hypothetical protein